MDDNYAMEFIDMMGSFNLMNNVETITSTGGHILDLVFCDMNHDLVKNVRVEDVCTISPVHKLVTFDVPYTIDLKQRKKIVFRNKNRFVPEEFIGAVIVEMNMKRNDTCSHGVFTVERCETCFSKLYNNVANDLFDLHCPLKEK